MQALREEIQGFRLSPHQRAAWAWQSASPAHQVQAALLLEGDVDVERLEAALGQVVRRHEVLRTNFLQPPWMEMPLQVIRDDGAVQLCRIAPGELSAGGREAVIEILMRKNLEAPFDLEGGPVVRVSLVPLHPAEHLLLLALPSVSADPWTLRRLAAELADAYAAWPEEADHKTDLLQYVQYSEWQNSLLEEAEAAEGRDFWRSVTRVQSFSLPFEKQGAEAAEGPFLPFSISCGVDRRLAAEVRGLFGRLGVSLSDGLFGCWQLLLWRLTCQSEIVVRRLFDGRNFEELHGSLGLFAKYLPVRLDFSPDLPLDELWREVRRAAADAMRWQESYADDLIASHPVLFDEEEWMAPRLAAGVRMSVYRLYHCLDPFKLRLAACWKEDGLQLDFHYDPRSFAELSVRRLAGWLQALLGDVVDHPEKRVGEVELLATAERHQLLREWGEGAAETGRQELFQNAVEAAAERDPAALAVFCAGSELSYGELVSRADQMALYLLERGVGPDVPVGICLERSVELLVALLGILRAGGAYVPLDPSQPDPRLARILADARPAAVVTRERWRGRFAAAGVGLVCLDTEWPAIAGRRAVPIAVSQVPENLAYAIYTSGSTGTPKGVMISHGALSHLLAALEGSIDFGKGPLRVGVNAPVSFDASVKQLVHLAQGRSLFIVPDEARADGWELLAYAVEHRLDVLDCTPAQLRLLLEAGLADRPELRRLRLLVGGEPIDRVVWQQIAGPSMPVVYNVYGPTECTVDATVCRVRSAPESPVIGRPIADVRTFLLDETLCLVPPTTAGQLFVGGRGLARGYLGRPALTAERFVPDPFSEAPGERLYATGDLARHRPDGSLEFLGRIDHQVKVRGFRVELGEIEAILAEHSSVREAVVVQRLESSDPRLTAYWVAADRQALSHLELRAYVRSRLPEYMAPEVFMQLPALPLTRHGKVDRRALPEPDLSSQGERSVVTPRTPLEEMLAELWMDLLGLARVSLTDDFFELGGHSLLATQLVSRVRKLFQVELPLRALFEAPRLGELAEKVATAMRAGRGLAAPPIVPADRAGELPLSFAQQRLWFLDQLQPGNPLYNLPAAVRLAGSLDLVALARSLGEIVRRHEVLRTVFPAHAGRVTQEIHPAAPFTMPVLDLSVSGEAAWPEALRLAGEEGLRPFDLARGPLVRAAVVRLAAADHILLLSLHHIVSDAWSMSLLIRELTALYRAFLEGRPSPLPQLPIQYGDFAVWQRGWLAGQVLEEQLSYWRQVLDGIPAALELPVDRPRLSLPSFRAARMAVRWPGPLLRDLGALGRARGATVFMVLLAAFEALLARLSGQEDLVVGTPVANRNREETEALIGFFINTLALRGRLEGDPSFSVLLERVREAALGAYLHQDLPFERLVEELQPDRNLSHTPLFQVMLVMQNTPLAALDLPGLVLEPISVGLGGAKFDLTLTLTETPDGLSGFLDYSSDLYDRATAARWVEQLGTLLAAAVARPEQRLWDLPVLFEGARHQVTAEWNDTGMEWGGRCMHDLVADQAAKHPVAVAVCFGPRRLTYGELDARANRLARLLRRLGVGPEVRVGVCLERSLDVVWVLLGILRSGGAYLPLDPSYPAERLSFIIEDGRASLLLTQEPLLDRLPACSLPLLCIDRDEEKIARESAEPVLSGVIEENLAYVMYTSGSTGKPKGVSVPHRALSWFVSTLSYVEPIPGDRFAQGSTHAFDAATFEVWGALTYGACLVGISKEEMIAPRVLAARLQEERISVLYLTAALFMQTASQVPDAFRSLRCLLVGGEVVEPEFFRIVLESAPPARLLHMYGPTETTVFSSWYEVREVSAETAMVSIGRSIHDTRHYLLDSGLQPVPIGVYGEVYIGGDGLARGYLNRPDLTAERFVPDAFSDRPGERLYCTGDLVRFLHDGRMEFGARMDNQVKIRGQRIELEEIEAVLCGHPEVRQAAVAVREERPGDRRLVGYVVPRTRNEEEDGKLVEALQQYLGRQLPGFMIPAALVLLESLPLTPSGKLDRAALPSPDRERQGSRVLIPPRTFTEQLLAQLWAEVLGLKAVGASDDFFALGGHSLLATQVVSRVREAFKVELPLRALFEEPTVAGLAHLVDEMLSQGVRLALPPIVPVPRTGALPLSFGQQRLWFLDQLQPGNPIYNVPGAVHLGGRLDTSVLSASLGEIVRRHEVLRTVFPSRDGRAAQEIRPALRFELPVVDLSGLGAGAWPVAEGLFAAEAGASFDLARGPLLRGMVARLGEMDHFLILNLHHIVSDGWSLGVLVHELSYLYAAFIAGRSSPLPDLPVQYADYAAWQQTWLTGEVLEAHLDSWRRQLGGALPVLELPTDHPRPAMPSTRGATERFSLPGPLLADLRALGSRQSTTLFMTLLAAFMTLLSRYTGQEDLVVGVPIAGRERLEMERLIGFFVNTLALRGNLSGEPSFSALLARVREVSLEAHANQALPFEKLVEELQPERTLSHAPLFQVAFALQNAPRERLELPGLTLVPYTAESGTAKFELTLHTAEAGPAIEGLIEFRTDLFDRSTIVRMVDHLEILLHGAATAPQLRIADLPLLSEAERRCLLADWNQTAADYPREQTVHGSFAEQVARAPDAVALSFGGQDVTYGDLDLWADGIALRLAALGVGADTPVGISAQRSPELIAGLLGILKAGGAYVPLDPATPRERLARMIADIALPVVLAQSDLTDLLAAAGAKVVPLPSLAEALSAGRRGCLAATAGPDTLAYVVFTSGSTGQPKRVAVTHRNVLRLVCGVDYASFGPGEIFLQYAPVAFDASTFEIWGCLLHGGRLAIAPPHALTLSELGEVLERERVTTLWLTAGLFHQMVNDEIQGLAGVSQLLAGGDVLSVPHVRKVLERLPGCRLVNGYGPTEGTTFTTCQEITAGSVVGGSVPIGRPIANTRVYVTDRSGHLVPAGVSGELLIGGDGLARGYLGQPELTVERFVPDPFGGSGGRLYRTGDLVRYRAGGVLEFLGRLDNQVKVRGFRIELEEIESVLGTHPGVRAAAVVARSGSAGGKRLVAYVVGEPGEVSGLRSHLRERLPDYMIPGAFVVLAALPLTANGKVDREALPEPTPGDEWGLELAVPRTPMQARMAAIWGQVLGVERVGALDDFFALGGHSLLATQVVSRVRETFGVDLPLRALFEAPTVAGLATRVEEALVHDGGPDLPPVMRVSCGGGERPLSFAQKRLLDTCGLLTLTVRFQGPLDAGILEAGFGEIVRRHEALRTTFSRVGSETVPTVHPATGYRLPLSDLSSLGGDEREPAMRRAAEVLAECPFDLARGPLLRVSLLRLGSEDHSLIIAAHPLVSDAWSLRVLLLRELLALYEAFLEGRPSPLPELPIQYGDFASWQHRSLHEPRVEARLARWRRAFEGAPLSLAVPADHSRSTASIFRGRTAHRALPAALTASLKRMSSEERATFSMVLLAACGVVIHHWTSESDIVVGIDTATRGQAETQELIGAFTDQLALRIQVRGDFPFREVLRRVREATLDAYQYQDIPFAKLGEALRPEEMSEPRFRLNLGFHRFPPIAPPKGGPAITSVVLDDPAAPHDLSFLLEAGENGVVAALLYNRGLFETSTIEGLLTRLETVVHAAGMTPDARIDEIEEQLDAGAEHRKERERQLEEARSSLFKGIRRLDRAKQK